MSERSQATPTGSPMWLLQQLVDEIVRLRRTLSDLQQQLDRIDRAA